MMLTIRRLLNWLGLFCLVGFFFPYYESNTMKIGNARVSSETRFTLGLPCSPWLTASSTETEEKIEKNENGTIQSVHSSNYSSSVNAELITWSSLLFIAGFALIAASRRLRPRISSASAVVR
jgi:hypothetical protein